VAYLLDTNVLSESVKRSPDPKVLRWLGEQSMLDLHLSTLSFGEIAKGVALLPPGPRRTQLEAWLAHDLSRQFLGRVHPVDQEVATAWGRLSAAGKQEGRELPVVDGLLLATAMVHALTLVTRNEKDCAERGVPIHNPWR
jgi:toxin FitB